MPQRILIAVVTVLGLSALCTSARAAQPAANPGRMVEAQLLTEQRHITPGKPIWLALDFTITSGWHMYWNGQNDTGMPPQLEFELPDGYAIGEVLWPAPERHVSPGDLIDATISEHMTLLIRVDAPVNAKQGADVRIGLKTEWLVCDEACILEDAALHVDLPVKVTTPANDPNTAAAPVFAAAREKLPRRLPKENSPATIKWEGTSVSIEAPSAEELVFFPHEEGAVVEYILKDCFAKGDRLKFRVKDAGDSTKRLSGVLQIRRSGKKPEYYNVSLPVPGESKPG